MCGCVSSDERPSDLFTLFPGEKLTLQQEKDRLKYGELLQPKISGDSLIMPKVESVPPRYVRFVKIYVDSLNRHLKRMSKENRDMILVAFGSNIMSMLL